MIREVIEISVIKIFSGGLDVVIPGLLYAIVNFVRHEWVDFDSSVAELAILQGVCRIFCLVGVPPDVGCNKGALGHIMAAGVIIALILAPMILAYHWIVTLLGGIFFGQRFVRLAEIRAQMILRRIRPEVPVFPFAERFSPFGNFITFLGGAHLRPVLLRNVFPDGFVFGRKEPGKKAKTV